MDLLRWKLLAVICTLSTICFSAVVLAEDFDDHLLTSPSGRMSGLQFRGFQNQKQQRTRVEEEVKTTRTGTRFVRDYSNPGLGEAWRDPSGMIWGDIVKEKDGTPRFMNHVEATDYCQSIGAVLPRHWDFLRLREYLGRDGNGRPYSPQVLPNLTYIDENRQIRNRIFWSHTTAGPYNTNDGRERILAYLFFGRDGVLEDDYRTFRESRLIDRHPLRGGGHREGYSVRCVVEGRR